MATATTSAVLGRHVWSELLTTDVKGAQAFYDKVIGWTSGQSSNMAGYYEFKRTGGSSVAGMMERPKGMPMSIWAMYIAVPNLEDAAAEFKRRGGATASDVITVPTVGRMQMVRTLRARACTSFSWSRPRCPRIVIPRSAKPRGWS